MSDLRKADHLRICLEEAVEFPWGAGFDRYAFLHQALPECDLEEVDLSAELFGRRLAAPLIISGMTGGTELARSVNRNLAVAAERLGLAMGLEGAEGWLRRHLVSPDLKFLTGGEA